MRFSLKIIKTWILFLALSPTLLAETLSQEEIQRLLKRVEVLKFDGRDMAQVPLKLILEVALERTLAFKSLALSEEAAQTQVIGCKGEESSHAPNELRLFKFGILKFSKRRKRKFCQYHINHF